MGHQAIAWQLVLFSSYTFEFVHQLRASVLTLFADVTIELFALLVLQDVVHDHEWASACARPSSSHTFESDSTSEYVRIHIYCCKFLIDLELIFQARAMNLQRQDKM